MRGISMALVAGTAAIGAAQSAWAHAFLDHASPAVGSSVPASPPVVTLWFTQDLEPAFSGVTVTNGAGQQVDLGKAQIPQGSPDELQIGLKPLTPGRSTISRFSRSRSSTVSTTDLHSSSDMPNKEANQLIDANRK